MENIFVEHSENHTSNLICNQNNMTTTNTILHFACLDYMTTYKTNLVPFDYIEYYIKKLNTYDKYFESNLSYFYKYAKLDALDISLLASIYSKSIISIVVSVVTKDSIEFIVTDEDPVDLLEFYMETSTQDIDEIQLFLSQ